MIWVFAGVLGVLAIWHYRSEGSALFPPVLYAGLWASVLGALAVEGDVYYPLSFDTLGIILLGSVGFGLGGHLALLASRPHQESRPRDYGYRLPLSLVLNVSVAVVAVALPFYWYRVQDIVAKAAPGDEFWVSLRTEIGESGGAGLGFFVYLSSFSSFLAVVAVYEIKARDSLWTKVRMLLLIAMSIALHLGSGGRLESLLLFFSITGVGWLRSKRVRLGPAILGGLLAVVIFAVVGFLLGKGASAESSFAENVGTMTSTMRHYVLSGTVGFDRFVRGYVNFPPGNRTFRFFIALGRALGIKGGEVAELILPNCDTPAITNVYTIWHPFYSDFGWAGVAIIPFLLGIAATIVYQGALRGVPHACILYAYFIGSLILCVASDMFVMSLSHWLQIGFYCILLFRRIDGPVLAPTKSRFFGPVNLQGAGRSMPAGLERDHFS